MRTVGDLERLTDTWTQIACGSLVDEQVSDREAVRILTRRLVALVHPDDARQPYVTAMIRQGFPRTTAYKLVKRAFALAADRRSIAVPGARTGTGIPPDAASGTGQTTAIADPPARPPNVVDTQFPRRREATRSPRPPLRADPLYYGRHGQPAWGATPWRYFRDNPKLPLYAPAAYPMTDAGVPVLDPLNWTAPYGVDETGTPLAPYGVTHRYGYPVRREGVPPGSPLPSPKTHAAGEEGWEDW